MASTYHEASFIFDIEREMAGRMRWALEKLGSTHIHDPAFLSRSNDLPHIIRLGSKGRNKRRRTELIFNKFGYKGGRVEEGDPTVYEQPSEEDGWEQTISSEGERVEQEVDDEITIKSETSEAWKVNASFGITHKSSIKAEASFGDIAGASATSETTITTSTEFGTGGTVYNSTSRTHFIKTKLIAKAGEIVQYTQEVNEKKIVTPIIQIGLLDFEITINFYDWITNNSWHIRDGIWQGQGGNWLTFDTRQALINFFRGRDEREFPNMKHFLWDMEQAANKGDWRAANARDFIYWLENDRNFEVRLEKERVQVFRNAGTLRRRVLQTND